MREELKQFIKNLYLKRRIEADRFKQLNAVANDLLDANDRIEEYQMLFDYASGDYPEFRHFLTVNRLRAAEDLGYRRAGERQSVGGVESLDGLSPLCIRVFDLGGLIQNQVEEWHPGQLIHIPGYDIVGCDQDLG